jgi:hypothetical protein
MVFKFFANLHAVHLPAPSTGESFAGKRACDKRSDSQSPIERWIISQPSSNVVEKFFAAFNG